MSARGMDHGASAMDDGGVILDRIGEVMKIGMELMEQGWSRRNKRSVLWRV